MTTTTLTADDKRRILVRHLGPHGFDTEAADTLDDYDIDRAFGRWSRTAQGAKWRLGHSVRKLASTIRKDRL